MKYGSVCSGIEAASVAWEPLGWQAEWFSEIEKFPSAVLAHRWPEVPNLGDMLELPLLVEMRAAGAPDVLVGGTPCQAFSVAGRRGSLEDERGALTLAFVELANTIDEVRQDDGLEPSIVVWENVPGVLNTKDNAFGCFLAGLAGETEPLVPAGKRWTNAGCVCGPQRTVAWRVLDAQFFGVAQRRRRVFVVASARAGFDPAAVLFESEGVRRDSPPSREAGQGFAADVAPSLVSSGRGVERTGGGDKPHVLTVHGTQDPCVSDSTAFALGRNNGGENAVYAFAENSRAEPRLEGGDGSRTGALSAGGGKAGQGSPTVCDDMAVRRLTPTECERLQGFPDSWTRIPWRNRSAQDCPDGPRYKAIGNSMAVPCMTWIGRRIASALSDW